MLKELQKNIFGLAATTLTIVVVIVMVQNAGGVAEIAKALFGGWNATLGTLLGRPAERV